MKTCSKCKKQKGLDSFHKRTKAKDGRQSVCIECKKELDASNFSKVDVKKAQFNRNKSNNRIYRQNLYSYMKDKSCIKCGEDNIACLQFDHRDNVNKIGNISSMIRNSNWNRIKSEIDKCDILCANCHMKRTSLQQSWYKDLE